VKQFQKRTTVEELCKWADIARSTNYYHAHPGERGMKASTHTPKDGVLVENAVVVDEIRQYLGSYENCVYGYKNFTGVLRTKGYRINKKKTYRLMKENRLLLGKVIKTQGKREWVKFRRIEAKKPMEYLCLDLKYVWVHGEKRFYYQLAIMDVFSRKILTWILQSSVRQNDVIALMRQLDLRFGLKGVIIRNDNGSQFIANRVRQVLQDLEAKQEFTHVATPEENAYIEAFHSIQQRELFSLFTFESFYEAKKRIEKYMYWYNNIRRHGRLFGLTPMEKWAQGMACSTVRQHPEPASGGLSRPAGAYEKSTLNQPLDMSLDSPTETAYLCLTGEHANNNSVVNCSKNSVQIIGG
jgi:putative transposase